MRLALRILDVGGTPPSPPRCWELLPCGTSRDIKMFRHEGDASTPIPMHIRLRSISGRSSTTWRACRVLEQFTLDVHPKIAQTMEAPQGAGRMWARLVTNLEGRGTEAATCEAALAQIVVRCRKPNGRGITMVGRRRAHRGWASSLLLIARRAVLWPQWLPGGAQGTAQVVGQAATKSSWKGGSSPCRATCSSSNVARPMVRVLRRLRRRRSKSMLKGDLGAQDLLLELHSARQE